MAGQRKKRVRKLHEKKEKKSCSRDYTHARASPGEEQHQAAMEGRREMRSHPGEARALHSDSSAVCSRYSAAAGQSSPA